LKSPDNRKKRRKTKAEIIYNERSYQSFNRRIPFPDEILLSKIDAKMENGILKIDLPKKTSTKVDEEETKVKVT